MNLSSITSNIYFQIFVVIILLFSLIQLSLVVLYFLKFIKKYFLTSELDLIERYGSNSWVLITGCSSGQGKQFVLEFAERGFNIILVGNEKIYDVEQIVMKQYNNKIKTKCIVVDFSDAYKENFFDPILQELNTNKYDLSILVNNVGHRVAWKPYHEMPEKKINDTIICGTIVQARLTQIAIQQFFKRKKLKKSAIINITAMCMFSNFWFGEKSEVSVPYLSVYEAANAFGFYHSNSIEKEYGEKFDILNIIPGAVLTENTTEFLHDIPFNVSSSDFVKNIFTLLGNYNGIQYAHWKHDLSGILSNFMSSIKNETLDYTGEAIAKSYMKNYNKNKNIIDDKTKINYFNS
jgi:hypothetical protein